MKLAILTLTFLLSSCSGYKSNFDCAPGKGVGCESVNFVNDLINHDELDDYLSTKKSKRCKYEHNALKQPETGEPIKVWIREHTDSNNVKHEAHSVYFLPKQSKVSE
jgi:hypothetical protein